MKSLKLDRRKVKFDDIVHNVVERVNPLETRSEIYVGLEHLDPDSLHLKRWGHPSDVTGEKLAFKKGDVIFGRRRAYQRKLVIAEFDGICSAHAMVLRAKPELVLPEFLPFFLQSDMFMERAIEISVGSLSPTVNWTVLRIQEFPLPTIYEQQHIAKILSTANAVEEAFASALAETNVVRRSILDSLDHEKFPTCQLGEVLDYASDGPFGSKLKTEHYSDTGARVVRLQNITPGRFDDSDKAYIPIEYYHELGRYALHPGDVLIAGLGDETHPVGRACTVPQWLGPSINKADCFCLRPKLTIVVPDFLCHFLNSRRAKKEISRITQGTTRYRINVSNLKSIQAVIPPLEIQRQFVSQLRKLDLSGELLETHLGRMKLMRHNLMRQLLE